MDKDEYRKYVNQGIENRFGYLREKTNEELETMEENVSNEIQYLLHILDSKDASTDQKSEIRNSDLKIERDKLDYIEQLLDERKDKRGIRR